MFHVLPFGERGAMLASDLRDELVKALVKRIRPIRDSFDYIVTVEPGGHIWANLVAHELNVNVCTIRERPTGLKTERSVHQTTVLYNRDLYFREMKRGDRVILVDDVISTGDTLKTVITTLKGLRVIVVGVFCIMAKGNGYKVIQEEGIPLQWLLDLTLG